MRTMHCGHRAISVLLWLCAIAVVCVCLFARAAVPSKPGQANRVRPYKPRREYGGLGQWLVCKIGTGGPAYMREGPALKPQAGKAPMQAPVYTAHKARSPAIPLAHPELAHMGQLASAKRNPAPGFPVVRRNRFLVAPRSSWAQGCAFASAPLG